MSEVGAVKRLKCETVVNSGIVTSDSQKLVAVKKKFRLVVSLLRVESSTQAPVLVLAQVTNTKSVIATSVIVIVRSVTHSISKDEEKRKVR